MGSSFTDEEKRFLLAEMIKNSRMDVDTLGNFIRAHGIEPNWLQMQLPFGRNMNQCMQAADQIGIKQVSWLKRKATDDQGEPAAKRKSMQGNLEPSSASAAQTHVPILPRPASSSAEITPAPTPAPPAAPPSTAPKKKGRPSRADKAKLRPILPQTIAPRPAEQNPNNPLTNQTNNQMVHGSATPRTILPANTQSHDSSGKLPAMGNYSTSYTSSAGGASNVKSGGTPQDETAHPRIMAEQTHEQFGSPRPNIFPSPVPLEPEPRASSHVAGGLHQGLTTLAPMLERDINAGFMDSPSLLDQHSPLANSA